MVKLAKSFVDDVEFSPMDATRTDTGYLCDVIEAVIEAGALTVNIPDTVGYSIPVEFGALIKSIRDRVKNIDRAVISVHCHNDLGLASSNSLSAVLNGAGQIECTINGIGERAGNCSMEEVVMALRTRRDIFNADTNINTEKIMRSSRLVTKITGMSVQPNKAIVGANAFAHESGIHQDGLLKEKSTYEIIRPETIGLHKTKFVLGKHSGRHAFRTRLVELGHTLNDEEINSAFKRFKRIADHKKEIFDEDLEALVSDEFTMVPEIYSLIDLNISSGTKQKPTATLNLKVNEETIEKTEHGDGPVDAVFKSITSITDTKSKLLKYEVKAITGGTDALGEVVCSIEEDDRSVSGHGADTDIIIASAKAYINALNKLAARKK
jgi:2-isopropylmalate synthase